MKYVLATKLAEMTGYTVDAIRGKRTYGIWFEKIHWIKAPDGRLLFNVQSIERWMESQTS